MQNPGDFLRDGLDALDAALARHGDDFRNVQIATLAPGGWPDVRTVVLRRLERWPAWAEIHSDARAGKVRDLGTVAAVTLLAWSAGEQLQIRLRGEARLHRGDALARERWEGLPEKARAPYGLRALAGAPVADPEEQEHLGMEARFGQFVVVRVALQRIDMLRLAPGGRQMRAAGRFEAEGPVGAWVGP